MKKVLTTFSVFALICAVSVTAFAAKQSADSIVWNGAADKAVAANIDAVQNTTRNNASGIKITSNAHSADFPGIYFIWSSKQKDNGYLKVEAGVFDQYESFTLTAKESNTYWDFDIAPADGQQKTADDCYVFYIPKVYNNKNINMVFLEKFVEKTGDPAVTVTLRFIGYYLERGKIKNTCIHEQVLNEGDMIDWEAADAAYDEWLAKNVNHLKPNRDIWHVTGSASFDIKDHEDIGFDNFNGGQLEGNYLSYSVNLDSGYYLDPVVVEAFNRYTYYLWLLNDIIYADSSVSLNVKDTLYEYSRLMTHDSELFRFEYYRDEDPLPSYFYFDNNYSTAYLYNRYAVTYFKDGFLWTYDLCGYDIDFTVPENWSGFNLDPDLPLVSQSITTD